MSWSYIHSSLSYGTSLRSDCVEEALQFWGLKHICIARIELEELTKVELYLYCKMHKISKACSIDRAIYVMSPDSPPFASASHGTFHSGIEYNLLQLISEKLKKSVRFEFLDVATNHDVLNHIIHGNLSEAFQMLVL